MASIRRMVIQGARMSNRTVDVLDGDRHDVMKNKNLWSWHEMETMWTNPQTFSSYWGHPKTPWFAGAFKAHEGHIQGARTQSTRERYERRGIKGKWAPAPGMGKSAMETAKKRKKAAAAAGGAAGGAKKKK
eukprot:TRINITY_DN9408_c0_g1_i1.p2 TRINITY_DN9408_c0_g1~~TRINITY_DN9408_c0_g1_i1.p2  ORF type:complete len:146 (+),score=48.46 TRINITY_DN9408_c0_g1_i1:46-438(+)